MVLLCAIIAADDITDLARFRVVFTVYILSDAEGLEEQLGGRVSVFRPHVRIHEAQILCSIIGEYRVTWHRRWNYLQHFRHFRMAHSIRLLQQISTS